MPFYALFDQVRIWPEASIGLRVMKPRLPHSTR
ncbi:hypothetical protein Hamer_G016982 [Homarus americanus]|uniref:Uncharacterized protein n=1 Tax=Homarus americanus TaxID=6706 RepID=A0A8J5NAV3_HOMAM|nr:hypothetical protein Hamer_G016982 [Homarus americanus]